MKEGELRMELSDSMATELTDLFDIEIEMLQADREKLPDGRTRYTLTIHSEEKGKLIKQFILSVMFQDKTINPS